MPLTPAAAPPLTPAERLWTATRDQAVKLRMEGSGPGSETPLTVHQMFLETVQNFGDHPAMASKEDSRWVTVSWREYYRQSRAAAKSFLKVCVAVSVFSVFHCFIGGSEFQSSTLSRSELNLRP